MQKKTVQKLCCPFDKHDIELTVITTDTDENILEGILTCSNCQRIYPIVSGIPIMNPDEYREFEMEKPLLERWEQHLKGKSVENFRLIQKVDTLKK